MFMPLFTTPKKNTPNSVRATDPLAPMMLVPPKTTAGMTSNSVPKGPYVAVWTREDRMIPARAAPRPDIA